MSKGRVNERPVSGGDTNGRGFDALKIPIVRNFALGRIVSGLGQSIVSVTVGWELYERTRDPWVLGLVGIFTLAPSLVLMLPAGNWADRYPRRNLALLASFMTALASMMLAIISWQEGPVSLVLATLMLFGAARAISAPAAGTILPQLLEPRLFANVNTWLISCMQIASVIGPAVGGGLIWATGGALPSYIVACALQLMFVGLLSTLPSVAPPQGAKRSLGDIFAGFAFMWRTPIFLAAITLDLFAVLLGGAVAMEPVYARDILMVGPAGLGLMRAAPGVGAMITMMIISRIRPFEKPGQILLLAVTGFGLATIFYGFSTNLVFSLFCLFMIGAMDSVSMMIRQTLMQAITPDELRGRVASVNFLFIGFSNELGAAESGAVAKLFGPVFAVVSGGVGTLMVVSIVAAKWGALLKLPPLHTLRPEVLTPAPVRETVAEPAGARAAGA